MNDATYQGNGLPKNYGFHYTAVDSPSDQLSEIIFNSIKRTCGTLLVLCRGMFRQNQDTRNRFKMKEPKLARQLDIQQIIKYGAVLYIMAALVAIPAGICSSSYQRPLFQFPLITPLHAPEYPGFAGSLVAIPDSKDQIGDNTPEEVPQPASPFHSHILKASQAYEVDAALIRAIIMAESGYNPHAISHRGAQGLMQLMPRTAKWLGIDDAFDPALNIDGGVRYFKRLLDRFNGDVKLALAAYNAGSRYVLKYGGVPPFKATHIYIKKVLKYHRKYQKEMASGKTNTTMS